MRTDAVVSRAATGGRDCAAHAAEHAKSINGAAEQHFTTACLRSRYATAARYRCLS
jgi:hypothetical protein